MRPGDSSSGLHDAKNILIDFNKASRLFLSRFFEALIFELVELSGQQGSCHINNPRSIKSLDMALFRKVLALSMFFDEGHKIVDLLSFEDFFSLTMDVLD